MPITDTTTETAPSPVSPVAMEKETAPFSFRKILWSLLLSLSVLIVIGYYTFEPDQFAGFVHELNPLLLGGVFGLIGLRILIGGWRLSYISHGKLSIREGTRGQLAWDFFSSLTPSAVGGGPFAAVYLSRDCRMTLGETTALMLFSMLLDQFWFALSIPALLILMSYTAVLPESLGSVGSLAFTALLGGILVWTSIFTYAVAVRPESLVRLGNRLFRMRWLRRFEARARAEMDQLQRQARILRGQPPLFFLKSFLLTTSLWLTRYLLPVAIIRSVFPDLNESLAVVRTVALSIGSMVLPTPGGSGGVEGLYVLLLGPPLIPAALVAPTLLVWRLLGYYLFLGLGLYTAMHHVQKSISRRRDRRLPTSRPGGDGYSRLVEPESVPAAP